MSIEKAHFGLGKKVARIAKEVLDPHSLFRHEIRQALRKVLTGRTTDDGPLTGIRVCDLTRILAGPFATMKLADMGAEVIKVEPPGGDDSRTWGPPFANGESCYFMSVNRGKRSIVIDLKHEEGKKILARLIKTSAVIISNFRPGTMERLGFGPAQVATITRNAIYCTISGYGDTPEQQGKASYDVIIQGESGVQNLTGAPDGLPAKVGISIADEVAGMLAVEGILAALLSRQRTGQGDRVDVSLLDGMLSLLTYQGQGYFETGESPKRQGNQHPTIVPYQTFATANGWLNIGVANDKLWGEFCRVIDKPELVDDVRFFTNADRVSNREILQGILGKIFAQKDIEEWMKIFGSTSIPSGRINNVAEALAMESVKRRGTVIEVDHPTAGRLRMIGSPIRLANYSNTSRMAPPLLGEHTDEILESLGFSKDKIAGLRKNNIVG